MLQGLQELRLQLQQAPKEASATAWGPRSSCQRVASLGCHRSQSGVQAYQTVKKCRPYCRPYCRSHCVCLAQGIILNPGGPRERH